MFFGRLKSSSIQILSLISAFSVMCHAAADDGYAYKEKYKEKYDKYYLNNAASVEIEVGFFFKNNADINIKILAQNAYGFGGYPQSESDEKKMHDVRDYLNKNIASIVAFDKSLNCTYETRKIREFDKHGRLDAKFAVKCRDDLRGRRVNFDFSQGFSDVKKIYLDLEGREKIKTYIDNNKGSALIN